MRRKHYCQWCFECETIEPNKFCEECMKAAEEDSYPSKTIEDILKEIEDAEVG